MTIRLRSLFFLFLIFLLLWFLYSERTILTPFILAGIFAYIFNPVVNFFSKKVKVSRPISVVIVYVVFIATVIFIGYLLTNRIIAESSELRSYIGSLLATTKTQVNALPDWLKPTAHDLLVLLDRSRIFTLPFFSKAISRVIGVFIFLFSGYYFLRDGGRMTEKAINFVPSDYKVDVEILIRKINATLGGYLRGQIFLVLLVAAMLFISLSILGVKFALLLSIFSGFAEIVPFIGPIIAATLTVLVVLISGVSNFALSPLNAALVVTAIYFVLRHVEDYFIVPYVMGKITRLPPFIIFFSVIAAGHIAGVLGLILAVPIAAVIKILLEFSMDQINGLKKEKS